MIIQMSDLNDERLGRFGNQLFKFFFLKIIQHEIDCEIRYPNWLGNLAFNIPNSLNPVESKDILVIHPDSNFSLNEVLALIREKIISGSTAIDVKGFFQFHTIEFSKYKDIFDETFKINPLLLNQIEFALDKVNPHGSDLVSIHIRRGDYTNYKDNPFFWTTSMHSIINSLDDLKAASFKEELVYICSDDMNYCSTEFSEKNISYISADNLFSYQEESIRLLVDFFVMAKSSVNIISNSSLSFFASMLNKKSRIFLRPGPAKEALVPYDPWNSNVLIAKKFQ